MSKIYSFGSFRVRPDERSVCFQGVPVGIGPRALDVLLALLARRERVVSKAELMDLAWPGLGVEQNKLSAQISALRKALGPDAIATVTGRGYRFATPVREQDNAIGALSATLAEGFSPLLPDLPEPRTWLRADIVPPQQPGGPGAAQVLLRAAMSVVPEHGGWVCSSDAAMLVAEFSGPRAAAACALRLQGMAAVLGLDRGGPQPGGWRMALHGDDPADRAMRRSDSGILSLLARLSASAQAGDTWVSDCVAAGLCSGLEGQLQELGLWTGAAPGDRLRVFKLIAPSMADAGPAAPVPGLAQLRPTLAVIPFKRHGQLPEPIGLGDVLADQLIGALARSGSIHVISRLSTGVFRDRPATLPALKRHLQADFCVSGTYGCTAGRLTVNLEVADAASGAVLWSHSRSDDESAVLKSDSALVMELVTGVTRSVFAAELRTARARDLPSLQSHTLLLAAISHLYSLSQARFQQARAALEELHRRAPRHPAPLAWLARWHLFRVVQGWSEDREHDGRMALDHANHALDLDPESSLALTMLGNVHTNYLKDLDAAEHLFDAALEVNPNESLAWLQKGNARSFRGDGPGALAHAERAVRLSPLDPARHFYQSILASAALTAGDYARAITDAQASLRLNSSHVSTHRVLAIALALQGRLDEARGVVQHILRLEPDLTVAGFIARSPGARSGLAQRFGSALQAAGLPTGHCVLAAVNGRPV